MRRHAVVAFALVALVSGCQDPRGLLEPPVAELAEVQALAARGDTAGIADHDIRCVLGAPGCDRIHEMTGDACLRLAQEALAAVRAAEAAPRASCARDRYGALVAAGGGEGVSARDLEALRLVRETSRGIDTAADANAALARRAEAHRAAHPASGAGGYYLATALVWPVPFGRSTAPCPDLARARDLAAAAAEAPQGAAPIDTRAAAAELARRADALARERGCTA